ncbi:hypothetical protein HMPREF1554_01276 [Porphyromonas gingivalis F0569]|nr:hypothetical protein HMPREF1554_01276 [Porphyromonas gingivalis F0569]
MQRVKIIHESTNNTPNRLSRSSSRSPTIPEPQKLRLRFVFLGKVTRDFFRCGA